MASLSHAALNLGEVLRGSRIYETPYSMTMGQDQVTFLFFLVFSSLELSDTHFYEP